MSRAARSPAWTETLVVPPQFQVTTLGPPVHVWTSQGGVEGALVLFAIAGVLLAGAIVLAVAVNPFACIAPLMAGPIVLVAAVSAHRQMRGGATGVVEYQDGFAALVGAHVRVFPWTEITSITSDVTVEKGGSMPIYKVSQKSGETVVLNMRISEVNKVIGTVKQHVHAVLLPPMQTAYDGGETLTFGAVTVNREEIASAGRRIAWSAVNSVLIERGVLVIKPKAGEGLEVRVSRIPNVEQLAALIGVDLSEYMLAG